MMRLRILKKLSTAAVPILEKHYRGQFGALFLAERGSNYHGLHISCRCPKRADRVAGCECQHHPLPGTPMVGLMSGYYEPEWEEETAFEWLHKAALWGNRPDGIAENEWAQIMRAARITAADQKVLAEKLERDVREMAWAQDATLCPH
jgi:hypothetical protein